MDFKIDPDSPIMSFFGHVFDLALLQLLFLVTCVPVVTIGTALTTMFSVLRKLQRESVTSVTATYLEDFKNSFKQSTIVWLILLAVLALVGMDLLYYAEYPLLSIQKIVPLFVLLLWVLEFLYVFPLMAWFDNSIGAHMKNALIVAVANFPISIVVGAMYFAAGYFFLRFLPVMIFLGISGPCFLATALLVWIFKKRGDLPKDDLPEE